VATDLTRIGQKARKEPKPVFADLFHHVYDVDDLRACFDSLGAHKATGVDGVTIMPSRTIRTGATTMSIASDVFGSNGSTATANARHTPGKVSHRLSPTSAGPQ
jgi:hypothetical protein